MKNVLVTGGGGFVGSVIVRQLLENGCKVIVAARKRYRELENLGAIGRRGDIGDSSFVNDLCRNVDTVFHTAAKAGIWGKWEEYERTNVTGTRNILIACKEFGIRRLVYTSTPSVVFSGSDIKDGDETLAYSSRFLCHYPKSKVMAEQLVLRGNSPSLTTCAIRPHLVWGPHDPHLIPRLIERGQSGLLKRVGAGENLVDITYVDNVAHAHILAAEAMGKSSKIGGQAYFIGQERPVNLWEWINDLFRDLGIDPVKSHVPFRAAYLIGIILEGLYRLLARSEEPRMTRFLAEQLARSHYFSHAKAREDFGYKPIISLAEGQKRLLTWLRENR